MPDWHRAVLIFMIVRCTKTAHHAMIPVAPPARERTGDEHQAIVLVDKNLAERDYAEWALLHDRKTGMSSFGVWGIAIWCMAGLRDWSGWAYRSFHSL
jgi:hypothetical protein